jgi:hypothetical protein
MAFGNRVNTTTESKLQPKFVDTVLNSNVLFSRIARAAKRWNGETLKKSIKVSQNSLGGSFSGFDTFSTSATDTRVKLSYDAKFYEQPVVVPLTEISVNNASAEQKIIDLATAEMESSAQDMADAIGDLWYSDGTGNGGKDFLGLGAIVDDGSSVATIGGQARAAYTTLQSTVTASGGTLSLAKMAALYNAVSSGAQKTTLSVTTETVFSLYEQLLTPQERVNKDVSMVKGGLTGGTGYTSLYYKGFPVVADEKATSGVLFFLNEDWIDWYALPMMGKKAVSFKSQIEGNDYSDVPGVGFSADSEWIVPTNQATLIKHIYLGGELTTWNPKRHGKLTGVTSV